MPNPSKISPKKALTSLYDNMLQDPNLIHCSPEGSREREVVQGAAADAIAMNPETEQMVKEARQRHRRTVCH